MLEVTADMLRGFADEFAEILKTAGPLPTAGSLSIAQTLSKNIPKALPQPTNVANGAWANMLRKTGEAKEADVKSFIAGAKTNLLQKARRNVVVPTTASQVAPKNIKAFAEHRVVPPASTRLSPWD